MNYILKCPRKRILAAILFFLAIGLTGCGHDEPAKAKIEPPKEEPVEEVFQKMEEDEMSVLIEKVRTYAETFEIGSVDEKIKEELKAAIPRGTSEAEALEPALVVIDAFMEEQFKLKIAEGLDEYVGRHTEDDVLLVYESMNTGDLITFILHYEIEILKSEGYLR